jgi:hypothetical protein
MASVIPKISSDCSGNAFRKAQKKGEERVTSSGEYNSSLRKKRKELVNVRKVVWFLVHAWRELKVLLVVPVFYLPFSIQKSRQGRGLSHTSLETQKTLKME